MVIVLSLVACLNLGQQVTGIGILVADTENATRTICLFDDDGANADFGIVDCSTLTSGTMAACIDGIEAVALAGNTMTGSAMPVLLLTRVASLDTLTEEAQLAALVVRGANASGIAVIAPFPGFGTDADANIANIVTYARTFAAGLAGRAAGSVYFAPDLLRLTELR